MKRFATVTSTAAILAVTALGLYGVYLETGPATTCFFIIIIGVVCFHSYFIEYSLSMWDRSPRTEQILDRLEHPTQRPVIRFEDLSPRSQWKERRSCDQNTAQNAPGLTE